jgi:hypothetical protein
MVQLIMPSQAFVSGRPRCSGLQTAALGLANKGDFEPTIAANMRDLKPTLAANEPTLIATSSQTSGVDPHSVHIEPGGLDRPEKTRFLTDPDA